MAKKKVGDLIKEARTNAGMTQAQLAREVGITSSDVSKAERGEKELTQDTLKKIAKATGVTQKSLLEAAKGTGTTAAKKTSGGKNSGKSTSSGTSMKVTATEKKLVELYRSADSDTKKQVMSLLKGESTGTEAILNTLLGSALDNVLGKK